MASTPATDSADFIEQARWLLEWHNRRSEAFVTRAVALLGFVGVVLGLLFQGADLKGVDATHWTWMFLGASLLGLLVAGLYSVRTIAPQPIAAPSVQQLRHWWKRHANRPIVGSTAPNIAESLLNSGDLTGVSALSAAKEDADRRGERFKKAVAGMVVALGGLTALLCNILTQTWRK